MECLDIDDLPSPCYVVDQAAIERKLGVIDQVRKASEAVVLLALKGFAMWRLFPMLSQYLDGVAASSLHEAQLGTEFGRQVHLCAPAYREDEFDRLMGLVDHVSFNSVSQWRRFRSRARQASCGIRINPQFSQIKTKLYDPCSPHCRLGVTADQLKQHVDELAGVRGLHFHTLCEADADALDRTLAVVERRFGWVFDQLEWINFGGGHLISSPQYGTELLIECVNRIRRSHGLIVYLEPGEAIARDAGVLVSTVLDLTENEMNLAIMDTSAAAHMPDVLEMPYRPDVEGAAEFGVKPHSYRLGGLTCLAGDVIGDYSFDQPLRVGDRLIFKDMAHYTMVKNTTFNGVGLPAIAIHDSSIGQTRVVRRFGYEDFRCRLS